VTWWSCCHSQTTSRPNDHTSDASASATALPATATGSTPAPAVTSTIPCTAATVFLAKLPGNAERSHGSTQAAATKAYRMTPIASTHAPSVSET
jgi:hypothetical protein